MNRVVALALRQKLLVLLLLAALLIAGGIAFVRLNIEAYPDPVPPLVEIVTQSTGLSAEEIERNITIPVEVQMAGIPHITAIRAISLFGLSDIKVQFSYDFTFDEAQQRVINRLSQLPPLLGGAQPTISPTSPTGEIFRYRLTGPPGYSVMDLKTIEDWIVERRMKAIPGVIDVTGWGGKTRTYEAVVDNNKLLSHGVTVAQVIAALGKSNANVGGQTVDFGPQAAIVRGIGLIQSVAGIEGVLVGTAGGQPVLLRDVAEVKVGNLPRQGIAGQDGDDDIVQGIVLMQRGAQSTPTITAVKAKIDAINAANILPPGVRLERVYDRSDLIGITTHTVIHNMVEGMLLIFILQWLFLGNLRSALIVAVTIPFALCFAVLILTAQGESANLLSVGALDFGLIVDATVIMVENIYRHLAERSAKVAAGQSSFTPRQPPFRRARSSNRGQPRHLLRRRDHHCQLPPAVHPDRRRGAYFRADGQDLCLCDRRRAGRDLHRLAGAVGAVASRHGSPKSRRGFCARFDAAISRRSLSRWPIAFLSRAALHCLSSWPGSASARSASNSCRISRRAICGSARPCRRRSRSPRGKPRSTAFAVSSRATRKSRRWSRSRAVPTTAPTPAASSNSEYFVPLKPFDTWPGGITKEQLTEAMSKQLEDKFPGIDFSFSQYIEDNVEEATSGVKGANSVKLFGPDLVTLERLAGQIKAAMAQFTASPTSASSHSLGQPTVRIDIDRAKAARYGLTPDDINGTVAGRDRRPDDQRPVRDDDRPPFPDRRPAAPEQRNSLEAIRAITVGATGDNGTIVPVPLSEVADVQLTSGASFIYREHQERYIPIKFSVRDRDLGGAVAEAKARGRAAGQAAGRLHARMGRRAGQPVERGQPARDRRADPPAD